MAQDGAALGVTGSPDEATRRPSPGSSPERGSSSPVYGAVPSANAPARGDAAAEIEAAEC